MSGLLFLTSEDFNVQRGTKGNIMCHNIPGFTLVLFYSTYCEHCQGLVPLFKRMPGTIDGCQFGMINVSTNRQCVEMSKDTVSPVSYVPYIVLYINGKPYMIYKGPHDAEEIRRFIVEVANNVQKKRQFSKEKVKEDEKGGPPEYSLGIPICGNDKVCYLNSITAYTTPK